MQNSVDAVHPHWDKAGSVLHELWHSIGINSGRMVVLPMPRKYSARQANKYLSQKLSLKLVEWRGGAKLNTKFLWACFNCGVYAGTNWKSAGNECFLVCWKTCWVWFGAIWTYGPTLAVMLCRRSFVQAIAVHMAWKLQEIISAVQSGLLGANGPWGRCEGSPNWGPLDPSMINAYQRFVLPWLRLAVIAWHLSKSRRNVQLKAGRVLDAVVLVDSFRRKLGWHWSHCLGRFWGIPTWTLRKRWCAKVLTLTYQGTLRYVGSNAEMVAVTTDYPAHG